LEQEHILLLYLIEMTFQKREYYPNILFFFWKIKKGIGVYVIPDN